MCALSSRPDKQTKEFHKTRVNELGKDNFSELTKNGRVKGVKVWKSECDLFEF